MNKLTLVLALTLGSACSVVACETPSPDDESAATAQSTNDTDTLGMACASNDDCAPEQYCETNDLYGCDFDDDFWEPRCELRPTSCDDAPVDPICACDGNVYDNGCSARAAGADTPFYGNACVPPEGKRSCGPRFCDSGTICAEIFESSFECEPLPEVLGCSEAETCEACFPDGELPGSCHACHDEPDGIRLECGFF